MSRPETAPGAVPLSPNRNVRWSGLTCKRAQGFALCALTRSRRDILRYGFKRKGNTMVYKMKPLEPIPEQPNPPPEQANSTDGKPARAPRTPRPQPLTRAEVAALVVEMRAELTGDTREEAQKLRHALKLPAMERLGLVITGRQPATAAQVMTASVAIIEDDDPTDKHDAGITADAIKAAE